MRRHTHTYHLITYVTRSVVSQGSVVSTWPPAGGSSGGVDHVSPYLWYLSHHVFPYLLLQLHVAISQVKALPQWRDTLVWYSDSGLCMRRDTGLGTHPIPIPKHSLLPVEKKTY